MVNMATIQEPSLGQSYITVMNYVYCNLKVWIGLMKVIRGKTME